MRRQVLPPLSRWDERKALIPRRTRSSHSPGLGASWPFALRAKGVAKKNRMPAQPGGGFKAGDHRDLRVPTFLISGLYLEPRRSQLMYLNYGRLTKVGETLANQSLDIRRHPINL